MNTLETIEKRRAVRHYRSDTPMPDKEFNQLLSSALLSPTAYNIQHWRFIRIKDSDTRKQLKEAAYGQEQVTNASELIIICADLVAWKDRPERYFANTDQSTRDTMLSMIQDFYEGKDQLQRDEAMRSCGIAAQTLMLAAKAMGYDTCPMTGFDPQAVANIINLPNKHTIGLMVTVGKAETTAHPRAGQLPLAEVVMTDSF